MNKCSFLAVALATALIGSGCATLQPDVPAPEAQVTANWPIPATATGLPVVDDGTGTSVEAIAAMGWRQFFTDPKLQSLIERGLQNNRDLRVAVLNVERARNEFRIQRADRVPAVNGSVSGERTGGDVPASEVYTAGVGLSFELDLFGRVRSLSDAALQRFLAQTETQQAVQLSLMGEIANAYITLGADQDRLALSQATLTTYQTALDLAEKRHSIGVISGLDLAQIRTQLEAARSDVGRLAGVVAQDRNAINLLVGEPVNGADLPNALGEGVALLRPIPEGLPSDVLLGRPDIRAAENQLLAANANIGAARAAFFPRIALTAQAGTASNELSGLFKSGSWGFTIAPSLLLPIFDAGRNQANLEGAQAGRAIAVAQYEKAIQAAFREVSDALAGQATLGEQAQAQRLQAEAEAARLQLADLRYRNGVASYLDLLDAQRSLFATQQAVVQVRLAQLQNQVALYKALGGGAPDAAAGSPS